MKNRWILNLVLLVIIAGLVAFLYLRPQTEEGGNSKHEVSTLKLASIKALKAEFPAKAPVAFEKIDGYWMMTAPYKQRADQLSVQRVLSIIAATSEAKLPATDLAKFGLDNPLVKLTLDTDNGEEVFVYGTYNSVTEEQYVAYQDNVYLLGGQYSEAAGTQPIEMVDKNILSPKEAKSIAGLNFSHLEQWEEAQLEVDINEGQWESNVPEATLTQNDMNEWLEYSWKQNPAISVERYTPDRNAKYPYFKIKLQNGQSIHLDKIMESPKLVLGRPDEGLTYHFNNDVGFNMLNPPLNQAQEETEE